MIVSINQNKKNPKKTTTIMMFSRLDKIKLNYFSFLRLKKEKKFYDNIVR